jgi:uncharacterized protein YjbJ (UPF0337 family)
MSLRRSIHRSIVLQSCNFLHRSTFFLQGQKLKGNALMDKDRIQGSAEQAKGKVKEVAGKVFGDTKLESEGKAREDRRQDSERGRRLE